MHFISTRLPYRQTNAFTKTVLDYIDQAAALRPFYSNPATISGIQKAIEARKQFPTNRQVLVEELTKQYAGIETTGKVADNIRSLLSADTFTITTAHQNNLFTGPLYFIYKIIHAIKLAEQLQESLPQYRFVPVYYIGSEDADLEELNHTWVNGEKIVWETKQTGAVGRMLIDKALVKLIDKMEGQLSVLPYGAEIISLLKQYYKEGTTIQDATFRFVQHLFADKGLVVLLPDNAALKKQMIPVFEDDLLHQTASGIVEQTAAELEKAGYKVQAHPREINLFYLKDNIRTRIEKKNGEWAIVNGEWATGNSELLMVNGVSNERKGKSMLNETELLKHLNDYPENFSPNVILRGLYQETILPNIAFIGGGGETAYWLQLKNLFDHYKVPFPVLVLRNSFLIVEKKWQERIAKLGFTTEDFFRPAEELLNQLVTKESKNQTKLNGSLSETAAVYELLKKQAGSIDSTLEKHVDALKVKAIYRLQELEKKMLRAEKRKFTDQQRQISTIKENLFPGNGLQERKENISYYFALYGKEFLTELFHASLSLEQEFVILSEK